MVQAPKYMQELMRDPDDRLGDPEIVAGAARTAHQLGFSVIRVKRGKASVGRWKQYQQQLATEAEINKWFPIEGGPTAFAVIAGSVSGEVELFEFEARAVDGGIWGAFIEACRDEGLGEVLSAVRSGYEAWSPSGGFHLVYRCPEGVERSTVLAATRSEDPEKPGKTKKEVLIETRGEGGIFVAPPSYGVHPDHPSRSWVQITGGLEHIATITADERARLHAIARRFDDPQPPTPAMTNAEPDAPRGGGSLLERFDKENTCGGVLADAEFTLAETDADGNTHWTRPGKDPAEGTSATVYADQGTCTLFSTSIDVPDEYIGDRRLRPHQLACALFHGGDYKKFAKQLKAEDGGDDGGSQKQEMYDLAVDYFDFGRRPDGHAHAVEKNGPNVALDVSSRKLLGRLRAMYKARHGKIAGSQAARDALGVLEGEALALPPVEAALRVVRHGDQLVVDLGDEKGAAVVIAASGWEVAPRSPVLFRRTNVSRALPVPVEGGDLSALRELTNIAPESWPVLLAWLVAAFIPDIPHPILLLRGEQGTGKSTTQRHLTRLVDPSNAEARPVNKSLDDFQVQAGASWVVPIDNLSKIPEWLSDALCRVVTGDGIAKRQLYTDIDVVVMQFRRVVVLTSIDPGAVRGDLAERLLVVDLVRIDPSDRRQDREIDERFAAARPELLGALLDLVAKVLAVMDTVKVDDPPRMADFAHIAAAVDAALGTTALDDYRRRLNRAVLDVIEADPLASATVDLVTTERFEGTATQLLHKLQMLPGVESSDIPKTPQALSTELNRLKKTFADAGIPMHQRRTARAKTWTIGPAGQGVLL